MIWCFVYRRSIDFNSMKLNVNKIARGALYTMHTSPFLNDLNDLALVFFFFWPMAEKKIDALTSDHSIKKFNFIRDVCVCLS